MTSVLRSQPTWGILNLNCELISACLLLIKHLHVVQVLMIIGNGTISFLISIDTPLIRPLLLTVHIVLIMMMHLIPCSITVIILILESINLQIPQLLLIWSLWLHTLLVMMIIAERLGGVTTGFQIVEMVHMVLVGLVVLVVVFGFSQNTTFLLVA